MKKLIKLMIISLFMVPFVVKANTYKPGEVANFVMNDDEYEALKGVDWSDENQANSASRLGTYAMYLGDGSTSDYARVLIYAGAGNTTEKYDDADYKKAGVYRTAKNLINKMNFVSPYIKSIEDEGNLDFITLEELKTIFDVDFSENPDVGVISVEKWKDSFADIAQKIYNDGKNVNHDMIDYKAGFWTGTVEDDMIWVVEFGYEGEGYEGDGILTSIEVKKVPLNTDEVYQVVPVIQVGKKYDCHYKSEEACFKCPTTGDDFNYVWGNKEDTKLANCVEEVGKTKTTCITPIPTGVADYALEIIGLVAVGTCLMIILKKKDFFIGA